MRICSIIITLLVIYFFYICGCNSKVNEVNSFEDYLRIITSENPDYSTITEIAGPVYTATVLYNPNNLLEIRKLVDIILDNSNKYDINIKMNCFWTVYNKIDSCASLKKYMSDIIWQNINVEYFKYLKNEDIDIILGGGGK
jgi:hypothetical protein